MKFAISFLQWRQDKVDVIRHDRERFKPANSSVTKA